MASDETTLVDTNVLLDLFTDDPAWADWSLRRLDAATVRGSLAINGVVYAELSGGVRNGVLLDFFIGAHAAVADTPLLTRDVQRYRTYFPSLRLIAPEI